MCAMGCTQASVSLFVPLEQRSPTPRKILTILPSSFYNLIAFGEWYNRNQFNFRQLYQHLLLNNPSRPGLFQKATFNVL